MKPEEQAREKIDALLADAGWVVQNMRALNLDAARGVAVREFPLQTGTADYLLFVDRKAAGVIEAKAVGLRDCQIEAITNLERSCAEARPRALIQAATGSGKTYTAVSLVYRLLKFAKARRVLFLVDRNNLGKQAVGEFQQYITPDDGQVHRKA